MTHIQSSIVGLVVVLTVSATAQAASFQGLGDLSGGDFYSRAYGVSGDGSVVVGHGKSVSGHEAFRWTAGGGMVGLGDLPGGDFSSIARDVSADGSVVVGYGKSDSNCEAFRWTGTDLGSDPNAGLGDLQGDGSISYAYGVSADGSVVVGSSGNHAFRWTETGGMVCLLGDLYADTANGISADGVVAVGSMYTGESVNYSPVKEAFRWTEAGGQVSLGSYSHSYPPWGAHQGSARDASYDGSVVVGGKSCYWQDPWPPYSHGSSYSAWRWTEEDGMSHLGDLPGGGYYSWAYAVSADGSVVVGYGTTDSGKEAFIWDEVNGMRSLKDVLVNDYGLNLTGWTLTSAEGISDDGLVIVGYGTNPDGNTEGWIATIPEPASVSLLLLGAVALLRRRKVSTVLIGIGLFTLVLFSSAGYADVVYSSGQSDGYLYKYHSSCPPFPPFSSSSADTTDEIMRAYKYFQYGPPATIYTEDKPIIEFPVSDFSGWTVSSAVVHLYTFGPSSGANLDFVYCGEGDGIVQLSDFSAPLVETIHHDFSSDEGWLQFDVTSAMQSAADNGYEWVVFSVSPDYCDCAAFSDFAASEDSAGRGPWMEVVPEPASVSLLLLGAVALLRRRKV